MSDIYVYSSARERIGLLQNVTAVQWLEHYGAPGEVKLDALATADNVALLVDGNRLYNTASDTVARICEVTLAHTDDMGDTITVRAHISSRMLDDRVVLATENISNIEAGMYDLYTKNRRFLPIETAPPAGYFETKDTQITWGSVLEGITKLAEISGLGFKVLFDPDTGVETLQVYKGINRSVPLGSQYVGHFGTDVGNVQNVEMLSGTAEYKNVAIIAGAGEGADRVVVTWAAGSYIGEARRELYVDARDIQREYQVAIPTGEYDDDGNPIYRYEMREYSTAVYNGMLYARGQAKLAERMRTLTISCDVVQSNIRFGIDYYLGDRMPIKLPEYGMFASARVSSALRISEKEGDKITLILSEFEILQEV